MPPAVAPPGSSRRTVSAIQWPGGDCPGGKGEGRPRMCMCTGSLQPLASPDLGSVEPNSGERDFGSVSDQRAHGESQMWNKRVGRSRRNHLGRVRDGIVSHGRW